MKPEFKPTNIKNIIYVRHHVLRKGRPIETCSFQDDNISTTLHYGAFLGHKIIGCLSLMKKEHALLEDNNSYQLRGMAVLPAYRDQKIGKTLLYRAEQKIKEFDVKTIWCNVRVLAIEFYKKNQYIKIGHAFDIPNIGSHVLMYKNL